MIYKTVTYLENRQDLSASSRAPSRTAVPVSAVPGSQGAPSPACWREQRAHVTSTAEPWTSGSVQESEAMTCLSPRPCSLMLPVEEQPHKETPSRPETEPRSTPFSREQRYRRTRWCLPVPPLSSGLKKACLLIHSGWPHLAQSWDPTVPNSGIPEPQELYPFLLRAITTPSTSLNSATRTLSLDFSGNLPGTHSAQPPGSLVLITAPARSTSTNHTPASKSRFQCEVWR